MPTPSFTQWQFNPPLGVGQPGAVVGSQPPTPWARSVLDQERMMLRATPEAMYPDGYLGTIVSRQGDRLLNSLKARQGQRSYQRGVHKGERVDPGDYYWPPELSFMRGIENEARGLQTVPQQQYWNPHLAVDGKMLPRGSESIMTLDPKRQAQLSQLLPPWSQGRGQGTRK